MTKSKATFVGFVVASIVPVVIILAVDLAKTGSINVMMMLAWTLLLYPFSAAATGAFGVPAFFLLHRFGLVRWWSALSAGLIIGAIVAVVLRLPNPPTIDNFLMMVPIGAASAFVFWLIWRLGHDTQKQDT